MKIHYRQPINAAQNGSDQSEPGISNCYFKELSGDSDRSIINVRAHHHTEFEIHIVIKGHQTYEAQGESFVLSSGDFIIFPPGLKHRSADSEDGMRKYSITFKSDIFDVGTALCGKIDNNIKTALDFIVNESGNGGYLSSVVVFNRIFETVFLLFRYCGFKEEPIKTACGEEEDERLALAEKYISDNIEQPLSVGDVAAYCYLSTKQLTRIFNKYRETSPAAYIYEERMRRIEELVSRGNLSFKEISRRFGFSGECYFNAVFRKYTGLSPGQYRKMHRK